MRITAKKRFARISAKKVRLVTSFFQGKPALMASQELAFWPKKAAFLVKKLLDSAISNARNNFNLKPETLKITRLTADRGPTFKRHWLRSRGQVDLLRKRTTNLLLVLEEDQSLLKPAAVKEASGVKPRRASQVRAKTKSKS